MINGIYLDPRSWKVDCISHPKWDTKKFGVNLFLYDIDNNNPIKY
jgi:hypothetical protein